ncbi:hypothetical protein LINPERHAP1_LOCUS45182 [Linum perenne]
MISGIGIGRSPSHMCTVKPTSRPTVSLISVILLALDSNKSCIHILV